MTLLPPDPQDVAAVRTVVDAFIQERLKLKLDKLKDDEDAKRQVLYAEHRRETWLADAAKRVTQIQLASHTLKPIHPDARGSSVYLSTPLCSDDSLVGTHILASERSDDVVGNAAALDIFKFLKLQVNGKTMLHLFLQNDPATMHALTDDAALAQEWVASFASIVNGKGVVASHTLGKQLYFPLPDGGYHLLAPLFPTALIHRLHGILQEDRFSDAVKAARVARKQGVNHPHGYHEYLNMVVQNFGGSKPQNISQLNSERGGANNLLASVPPVWQHQGIAPPLRVASVFDKRGPVGRERDLWFLVTKVLRPFLLGVNDYNNINIRNKRQSLVQNVIDTVLDVVAQIQCLPTGWSQVPECKLSAAEKRWLDVQAYADGVVSAAADAPPAPQDWPDAVSERFAHWLNAVVSNDILVLGDAEFLEWKHQFKEALSDEA